MCLWSRVKLPHTKARVVELLVLDCEELVQESRPLDQWYTRLMHSRRKYAGVAVVAFCNCASWSSLPQVPSTPLQLLLV